MQTETAIDRSRLADLETVIERGQQTFIEVGMALAEIRDARLYRQEFSTFEEYCKERWGWQASRARQLIGAAEAVASMQSVTIVTPALPVANEGQARELAKIKDPEIRAQIWEQVNEIASEVHSTVTAKLVKEAVQTLDEIDRFDNDALLPPEPPTTKITDDMPRQAPDDALWLWGRLRDFEREYIANATINEVVGKMSPIMRNDVRRIVPELTAWFGELENYQQ